jgi:signal transduction histidine kinase
MTLSTTVEGDQPIAQKHILFLAVDDLTRPYLRLITDAFSETALADPVSPAVYFEALDATRFQKADYLDGLSRWYRQKYAETRIDLIVAIGEDAVAFLARQQPWPGAQVLYFDVGSIGAALTEALPRASGILLEDHFPAALGVIKRILPDTERVALVYGASAVERARFDGYPDRVRAAGLGLEPVVMIGVPSDRLIVTLNALPSHSAVIMLSPNVDTRGSVLAPDPPCALLATSADRPAFTLGAQDVGCGVVGGLVRDWTKVGRLIAERALALVAGGTTGVVTVAIGDYTTLAFDARQLARWRIAEARLPVGSLVRFQQPSLWRDHRPEVVAAIAVGVLQTAIIGTLLVEHRRRRRAEIEGRQHLVAMAHLDRRAAMGELATSLAHEINQPLNAILQNAGAARMMVDSSGGDALGEVREILEDIRKDDLRASEIIRRMRGLLRKQELELVPLNLADLAIDTMMLVESDARSRHIALEVDLDGALLPAFGDRVHLQQVLLNLLLNAMDAVATTPENRRGIRIGFVRPEGRVGIAVRDNGTGIATDQIGRVFEPFFTTKGEGMGMGLAIARSIIEWHSGRIVAENNDGGGATVWFDLPSAR